MRNKLPLFAVGVIGFAFVFYFLIYRGTVEVTISQVSAIKESVSISFSADDYKKSRRVPSKVSLRPGTYTFIASAPGSIPQTDTITISAFVTTKLAVVLNTNPDADLPGSNPTLSQINSVPYLNLFPKITGDYKIEAITDKELTKITSIQITAIHRFFSPTETTQYNNERDVVVNAAKKWLSDNKIPGDIPITIKDEY